MLKKTLILTLTAMILISAAALAIDRERGVKLGEKAPAFSFPDRYGKMVSLDDFAGKKVILYFWVSWCVCREELPKLQAFLDANPGKNFEVVSVSIDAQGIRYVAPIADIAGVKHPMLLDIRATSATLYHYPATPAIYMINEAGVVTDQIIQGFEMSQEKYRKQLEDFIATPAVDAPQAKKPDVATERAELEKLVATADSPSATRQLAGFLSDHADFKAAIPFWTKLAEAKKPKCPDLFSLGSAYFGAGDKDNAIKYWKAAFKCDQTNYIYMRTAQSFEKPDDFYVKDKMKELYPGEIK